MCNSINEFKKQIIEHPDFEILVRYAINQYNLRPHMRLLKLNLNEVYHLVRCEIWESKSKKITEFQITTIVVYNTRWCLKRNLYKSKNMRRESSCDTQLMAEIDASEYNGFNELEAKDFIAELQDAGLGFEIDVILNLSGRSSAEECIRLLGKKVSRQRIEQIRKEARKKIKFAAEVIYGQKCSN